MNSELNLLLFQIGVIVYKFGGMNFREVCGWLGTLLENVYDFLDNEALSLELLEHRVSSSFILIAFDILLWSGLPH